MPVDIGGGNYVTKVPALSEDADIQEALKLYHFGDGIEPQKSMVAHLARIEAEAIGTRVLDINTLPGVGNNLDNITQSGFYVQSTPALASSGQNYPPFGGQRYPGILTVTNGSPSQVGSGIVYQEYNAASVSDLNINFKFIRRRFPDANNQPQWSQWKRLVSEDDHNHNTLYYKKEETFNPSNPADPIALGYTKAQSNARFLTLQNLPQTTPTGSIVMWPGDDDSAPEGWVACNGASYQAYEDENQTIPNEYTNLYNVLGVDYGDNGPNTFRVPNLRGRVPVGVDNSDTNNPVTGQKDFAALGQTGGAKTTTLTISQMPSHTHTQNSHSHNASTSSTGGHNHSGNTGGGEHNHSGNTGGVGLSHTHSYSNIQNAGSINFGVTPGGTRINAALSNNSTAGRNTGNALGNHAHSVSLGGGGHSHSISLGGGGHNHNVSVAGTTAVNQNSGGGQPHNNIQPYIVLNYIIKL